MKLTDTQRQDIARILETIARDGLPGARDLDTALDAIEAALQTHMTAEEQAALQRYAEEIEG